MGIIRDISPDILFAAKKMATQQHKSTDENISDLARKSLPNANEQASVGMRNGFPILPPTGQMITSELIKGLLDAEQSRASSPRLVATAYCQGTLLRSEIEARENGKLASATDFAESVIAQKYGNGEVAAKIQAHVISAMA